MSVVALIDMRDSDKPTKKKGDIICVKKEGEPWGRQEVCHFVRVKLEDPELEALLDAQDDPHPVLVYPYAQYEEREVGGMTQQVMINRSTKQFDITQFSNDTAAEFDTTLSELSDHITETPVIWKKNTSLGKDNSFVVEDFNIDDSDRTQE